MPTHTLTARNRSVALLVIAALLSGAGAIIVPAQQPQQETVIEVVIGGDAGAPPRFAVPDFVAMTPESAEIAKVIDARSSGTT